MPRSNESPATGGVEKPFLLLLKLSQAGVVWAAPLLVLGVTGAPGPLPLPGSPMASDLSPPFSPYGLKPPSCSVTKKAAALCLVVLVKRLRMVLPALFQLTGVKPPGSQHGPPAGTPTHLPSATTQPCAGT